MLVALRCVHSTHVLYDVGIIYVMFDVVIGVTIVLVVCVFFFSDSVDVVVDVVVLCAVVSYDCCIVFVGGVVAVDVAGVITVIYYSWFVDDGVDAGVVAIAINGVV